MKLTTMHKIGIAGIAAFLLIVLMFSCSGRQQAPVVMAPAAPQVVYQQPAPAPNVAGQAFLGSAVGSAVGNVVGNALSRPAVSAQPQTVIVKKYYQRPATSYRSSYTPSYRSSYSRSYGRR